MIFSENFLSVEIFLEWKWAFTLVLQFFLRFLVRFSSSDACECVSWVMNRWVNINPPVNIQWVIHSFTSTRKRKSQQKLQGLYFIPGRCLNRSGSLFVTCSLERLYSLVSLYFIDIKLLRYCGLLATQMPTGISYWRVFARKNATEWALTGICMYTHGLPICCSYEIFFTGIVTVSIWNRKTCVIQQL
jgi:hypothetical protein